MLHPATGRLEASTPPTNATFEYPTNAATNPQGITEP